MLLGLSGTLETNIQDKSKTINIESEISTDAVSASKYHRDNYGVRNGVAD